MPSTDEILLGAVLRDNRQYRVVVDIVTGQDFNEPRLGAVFDSLVSTLASGQDVDQYTVETRLPEWGLLGIRPDEPYRWADAAVDTPTDLFRLAHAMRDQSTRRRARIALQAALEDLNDAGKNPAQVVDQAARSLLGTPRATLTSQTLQQIMMTPDVYDWAIPGLLEKMDRLILTGFEGHGKTTMARQLLIASAAGLHPFTLEHIDPVNALVVDAENTARQWKRASRRMIELAALQAKRDPTTNIHLSLSGRINLLDPLILAGIHRLIDEHKPDIVFIGPLYRLAVQMNTDEQAAPVIAALDAIRDRGVALVIEAHSGHQTEGGRRALRPRGSSQFMGWPEFGFGMRKNEDEGSYDDEYEFVAWRGAREERDWPRQLRRGRPDLGDWPWVDLSAEGWSE